MGTKTKWKKRQSSGGFWKPEEGDELVGTLTSIRQGDYTADIYDIKTPKGIITIPSSTVLRGIITSEDLDKKLRIKFTGWGQGKGGKYRIFEVSDVDDSDEN